MYGKNKEYQKEKKYPTFNFPVNYAAPGKFSESVAFAIFCGITRADRDFQYPISICIVHTGYYIGCIASQTIKLVNLFYFTKEQFKRSLDTLRTGSTIRSQQPYSFVVPFWLQRGWRLMSLLAPAVNGDEVLMHAGQLRPKVEDS